MIEGITFDDVLLAPAYSEVTPRETCLDSRLTKRITIHMPLVSAAMDTVTEYAMAKALARNGGVGVIHKNMSIKEQAEQVDRIKRTENGIIYDPLTIAPEKFVTEADQLMREYKVGGLAVVNLNNELLGMVTNRDIRFEDDPKKTVKDLMTPIEKLVTAREGITLLKAKKILHENKVEKLPIVDENNIIKGLITIKDINSVVEFPNATRDTMGRLVVGASVGTGEDTMERAQALIRSRVDFIVVDTAHGHSKNVLNTIRMIKQRWPEIQIIGGNIATAEATKALIEAGVDAVKVGIGPGSICTTRVIAGIGVPQLTAIEDCAKAASEFDIPVIADGGIRYSGDIVKAIAAGASSVMLGSIFAGTEEAPGEAILYEGRKYKSYRGMGSIGAMVKGSSDRYFQSGASAEKLVPEGVEGMIPYKGSVEDIVYQLCGGLRSGMGYCGAKTINELQKKAKFIKITNAARTESHPHDIKITKESPNYQTM
ncbi:MAG TPA: IMP dehydrogenase [Thermotogota bacterium]|nr:IMP dehydrogenase [Thermotogota bacterium]HRW35402.1 IMP dehydrogenase [Thermotogota bacterium]